MDEVLHASVSLGHVSKNAKLFYDFIDKVRNTFV